MPVTYNDNILVVDNTILSSFVTCPLRAAISYGLERRLKDNNNAPLEVGQALHEALAAYYIGYPADHCLGVLANAYEDWSKRAGIDDKRLSFTNIRHVWLSWVEKNPQDRLPFRVKPEHIECSFQVPLDPEGSILFTGAIDMLAQSRVGTTWYIVDHKSTGQIDARKKLEWSMGSQLTGYMWALQQLGYPISGLYINLIHVGIVPISEKRCPEHGVIYRECGYSHMKHELIGPIHRSPRDLHNWHRDALNNAQSWRTVLDYVGNDHEQLHDIEQRGKFIYQACTLCNWREVCKSGVNTNKLMQDTEVAPWFPGVLNTNLTLLPDRAPVT